MLEKDIEWPIGTRDLADLLEVSHSRIRGVKFYKDINLIEGEDIITRPGGRYGGNLWTERGAIKIAAHLYSMKAIDFQEKSHLGKIFKSKAKIENKMVSIITKAIVGFTDYEKQFSIGEFKVDLYLPNIRLAIEIDEKHHNYNKKKDIIRESFISNELTCKFLRINPDEDNIGDIINIIFCYIFNKEIPEKKEIIKSKSPKRKKSKYADLDLDLDLDIEI